MLRRPFGRRSSLVLRERRRHIWRVERWKGMAPALSVKWEDVNWHVGKGEAAMWEEVEERSAVGVWR